MTSPVGQESRCSADSLCVLLSVLVEEARAEALAFCLPVEPDAGPAFNDVWWPPEVECSRLCLEVMKSVPDASSARAGDREQRPRVLFAR